MSITAMILLLYNVARLVAMTLQIALVGTEIGRSLLLREGMGFSLIYLWNSFSR